MYRSSSPCMVGDASQILLLKGQISSFLIYIFLPRFTLNPSGNLSACINFYCCAAVPKQRQIAHRRIAGELSQSSLSNFPLCIVGQSRAPRKPRLTLLRLRTAPYWQKFFNTGTGLVPDSPRESRVFLCCPNYTSFAIPWMQRA